MELGEACRGVVVDVRSRGGFEHRALGREHGARGYGSGDQMRVGHANHGRVNPKDLLFSRQQVLNFRSVLNGVVIHCRCHCRWRQFFHEKSAFLNGSENGGRSRRSIRHPASEN